MSENPYQSSASDPTDERRPAKKHWLLSVIITCALMASGITIAVGVPSFMHASGMSAWWFVLSVFLAIAVVVAVQSWKSAIALVLALPIGFLVGAVFLWTWFWTVENTSIQVFTTKDTGPLGMVLVVLLPGVIAFAAAFAWLNRLLGGNWR